MALAIDLMIPASERRPRESLARQRRCKLGIMQKYGVSLTIRQRLPKGVDEQGCARFIDLTELA